MEEQESSNWDGSNSTHYMGEGMYCVGDRFKNEYHDGEVNAIYYLEGNLDWNITAIEVNGKVAMTIPPHAVLRLYYD